MAKRLTGNISSQYLEAANRLRSKNARKRIVAYVESYDDILFWRTVLSPYENEKRYFEVMLPSHKTLERGKKSVLMNLVFKERKEERGEGKEERGERTEERGQGTEERDILGPSMLACVDADYDYLIKGATETSRKIWENPYVLHTYAYSIENLQCYAPSLHNVVVMVTLNDSHIFDFEEWLRLYSEAIFPLFVWSIWAYRYDFYKDFRLTDFCDTVSFRDINPYHPQDSLEYVRRHVNRKINWLHQHFPQGKKTYAPLRDQLLGMGLTPETCYLYMQGHTLFENVVMSVLSPICTLLRKEREKEINSLAGHATQRQNELSSYQHSQSPVDEMLRKGTCYKECPPYQWLKEDIMRLML